MSSQQHNPHLHHDKTIFQIGKKAAWTLATIFLTMLATPPVLEHILKISEGKAKESPIGRLFSWNSSDTPFLKHLHGTEKNLDKSFYSEHLRQSLQTEILARFGEGTRQVFVGFDGWLFYRPDLDAITGFGPLNPEPFSVMKDPELGKLPETRDVILDYAQQLKERGIDLLIVPVPLKPMVYNEYINPQDSRAWLTHPDAPAFYQLLRNKGIGVLDLTEDFANLRSKKQHVFVRVPDRKDKEAVAQAEAEARKLKQAFLKQDTHWTVDAMRFTAEKVAAHIRENYPQALQTAPGPIRAVDGATRYSLGDLVYLMGLPQAGKYFGDEEAFLRFIPEGTRDRQSPIVLLGDSFVNIYDDPTLGFDDPKVVNEEEKLMGAGFSQNLSLLLQMPLDVYAINAKGSTTVRQEFARRPDNEVRAKKLVVWVIASRDILLSRTAAHRANIEWAKVNFSTKTSEPSGSTKTVTPVSSSLVVEAVMTEKSANQDPQGTPYRDALHAAVYDIEKVAEGTLSAKQIIGVQWTFRDKVMQPTSETQTGKRYRLTLSPWDSKKELQGLNLVDTTSAFDAERWFVEKLEPLN